MTINSVRKYSIIFLSQLFSHRLATTKSKNEMRATIFTTRCRNVDNSLAFSMSRHFYFIAFSPANNWSMGVSEGGIMRSWAEDFWFSTARWEHKSEAKKSERACIKEMFWPLILPSFWVLHSKRRSGDLCRFITFKFYVLNIRRTSSKEEALNNVKKWKKKAEPNFGAKISQKTDSLRLDKKSLEWP